MLHSKSIHMARRAMLVLLAVSVLLTGCNWMQPAARQYSETYLTLFDTVTTVMGRAESKDAFQQQAQAIHDQLLVYHQLFDIYNDYSGINNLKTVNDRAGIAPVTVDSAVIALLRDCKHYYTLTGGKVNAAMGSVLRLWHEARAAGIQDPASARLPDIQALEKAAAHTDFDTVQIDESASTVFITDPEVSLDVGAIAKGWATQRVAEAAPEGMLISVGGNVCATGPKDTKGTPWVIGIQDPMESSSNVHTIELKTGSVVTSGDYQRTYTVDGKKYHHIIDPETRMPADLWCSVSIICADSGLADALSTALFLLPLEEGTALAESCGAEVLWISINGEEFMTPGFRKMLRS